MWLLLMSILDIYITYDLSDDDDINRQRRTLFVQGNIILPKLSMCSLGVKLTLFCTYCSPMYTVYSMYTATHPCCCRTGQVWV